MSFNVAFNFLCGVISLMGVGASMPHKEVEERNEGKLNKEEKEAWKNNLTKLNKWIALTPKMPYSWLMRSWMSAR